MTEEVMTSEADNENEIEAPEAAKQTQGSTKPIEPDHTNLEKKKILEKVRDRISINKSAKDMEDMRKKLNEATYIAGRLALTGQITVLFAGPNTGKTLLSLYLVSEAIAAGTAGKYVYHLNLDDTYLGLITKGELGLHYGFKVVSPENLPSPAANFIELVDVFVTAGVASEIIFILDTIKKFVNVMDKRASAEFMSTCRRFTSAGGTIIALSHTNKNKSLDDKSIPSGTSDVLDDCDCAYTLDILSEDEVPGGTRKTVEFQSLKSRGPVATSAVYRYIKYDDGDYIRMFGSVEQVDGNEADKARQLKVAAIERQRDTPLINAISTSLQTGEKIQSEVVSDVLTLGKHSRAAILACLNRWRGSIAEGGIWDVSNGVKNAKIYQLNTHSSGPQKNTPDAGCDATISNTSNNPNRN